MKAVLAMLACVAALLAPATAWSSALFTKGAGNVQSQVVTNAGDSMVLFTHAAPGEESRPLATVWHTKSGGQARTVATWFDRPRASSPRAAELNLVGLERLYQHLFYEDPAGDFELHRFELGSAGKGSVIVKAGSRQGDVLRSVALARERVVAELAASGSRLAPVPWSVASMEFVPPPASLHASDDLVSVRVTDAGDRPIVGATLTASRGVDMICTAKSDSAGMASCTLIDTHGHPPGEHAHEPAPVIVTFGGVVSPQRIDVPTTLLVPDNLVARARALPPMEGATVFSIRDLQSGSAPKR